MNEQMWECSKCNRRHPLPAFDEEVSRGLSSDEVRARWPRQVHVCECGTSTIVYASYAHYLSGDY